eukprot:CAMPEP_0205809646 /NCGR_PEP_ID=MMETSP0205-20121125/13898_1 /ASSEMBLY_ACC=CAM_ASM_000278 /TAXON_ID=36767 /ORGANISM="Euplotes focardii, Strain TN1" /LENGTH=331 /DNA_ID=CAMNT_0053087129 /DNA_START=62 /DNA_END=1058 /DNA_ORIENTATION=+
MERVKQVNGSDQSIEEIEDEDDESFGILRSKSSRNSQRVLSKNNHAGDNGSSEKEDPYSLLFEPDLSINKMIDDIITNDHYKKFSGDDENFCTEEFKDESSVDIEMEEDDEMAIAPEFNIDDIVTHIQEPHKNSPLTRDQKKSFKYLNKFQNIRRSKKSLYSKEVTSISQKRRSNKFKINKIDLPEGATHSSFIKSAFKRKNSFSLKGKGQNKKISNIDSNSSKTINNFYQLLTDINNKDKILELFRKEGKGGVIEMKGEPIFPLKMTIDYLLSTYKDCLFNKNSMKALDINNKLLTPSRRAFKETKNFNNMSDNSSPCLNIEVEGRVNEG